MTYVSLSTAAGRKVVAQSALDDAKRHRHRLRKPQQQQLDKHGPRITQLATEFYAKHPEAFNTRHYGQERAVQFVLASFLLAFLLRWLISWLVGLLIRRFVSERRTVSQGRWQ